ncbi:MAG: aspartate carbamoyltransferase regulatory subunit [Lachnospiraceae bacterium]|nr:aspartate carbamoyltransferase regulatory subunit [Sarcina sp.]MBR2730101.1 aspartate carbamoyltransferase regulatory subunit [Lachnospiraceae bacterium]
MLNVGKIENGIVLDHIHAGRGMSIYHHLQLNKLECPVAIIKNARSNIMGKKDILKIETDAESINLDVIPFIDPDVTVNIIRNGELVMKKRIQLPKEIRNVIRCNNPRCITTIEQGIQHIFYLADTRSNIYRCRYCDEKYTEQETDW